MSNHDHNVVVGWRMKDRYRFRNPDLVAIRFETECREVFDMHEAICDLIDEERTNRIRVSPLTIATMIHDFPEGDTWAARRIAAFEGMRERGLIEFDGDVTLYGELVINLPQRVYERWHEAGKKSAANERPKDPSTGRFIKKAAAQTTNTPNGSPVVPGVDPDGPLKDKDKDKAKDGSSDTSSRSVREEALELVIDTLHAAGGTSTDRSMWESLVRDYASRYEATPVDVFGDVAQQMLAKATVSGRPFAYDRGASYWRKAFTGIRRDHAEALAAINPPAARAADEPKEVSPYDRARIIA